MSKRKAADVADEFDPRVPLALEGVLVEVDYSVLLSLLKDNPDELRTGLEKLERTIREQGAASDLDNLCAANCDRRALLWLLHPFSKELIFRDARWSSKSGPKSIKAFFGISSRELGSLIEKLNEVASQLGIVIGQPELGSLLRLSKPLYPVWRLPRTLGTGARVLRYASQHFAGNSHIYESVAKARLTAYVQSGVGRSELAPKKPRWHDEEIAAVISSVSDDKDRKYDASAHRMWRHKHYKRRLSMLDSDTRLSRAL